jgi:TolB-like protein
MPRTLVPNRTADHSRRRLFTTATTLLLAPAIIGTVLLGAAPALAASPAARQADKPAELKLAVVEFTPEAEASRMTHEAKRHLQASLAQALFNSQRFRVVDVKWTREASRADLDRINRGPSTSEAVRLGRQLGVSYVLTGSVVTYEPKGADGHGRATLKTRLVEVATGKVRYAGETVQRSAGAMRTDGVAEMHTVVLKPAIQALTATLEGVTL